MADYQKLPLHNAVIILIVIDFLLRKEIETYSFKNITGQTTGCSEVEVVLGTVGRGCMHRRVFLQLVFIKTIILTNCRAAFLLAPCEANSHRIDSSDK